MMKFIKYSAALLAGIFLIGALMIAIPFPTAPDQSIGGDFLIRDVNIVDVENGDIIPNQDVVVQNGRVTKIERHSGKTPLQNYTIIDGSNQYLMPGLWDMHTHSFKISPQFHHPLFVANGVTGVRDMSGCMSERDSFWACIDDREQWNQAVDSGAGMSPRYIMQSSYQLNGGSEVPAGFPEFFKANNINRNKELVQHYVGAGADFLKTYSELSPEAYHNLAKETQAHGLTLAGHRPLRVSLQEAIRANQRSIEHPRLFLFECFERAGQYRKLSDPMSAYDLNLRRQLVDDHDPDRCSSLMQQMAESSTHWTPTLQVLEMSALAGDNAYRQDAKLKYIPFILNQGMWQADADRSAGSANEKRDRNVDADMFALAKQHLLLAHEAGVKILVGTDAGDTYVFPGFSVHREMELFVDAGISPQDTIRIATIDAARFSGLDREYGSIAEGKRADMIMLDANPYADIRHTQNIDGLFLSGRYFDRSALDEILLFAERQAGSIRFNLRYLWAALNSPLMRVQLAD